MGDSSSPTTSLRLCCDWFVARIRGLENLLCLDLGLTPQGVCFRLLRRLYASACFAGLESAFVQSLLSDAFH